MTAAPGDAIHLDIRVQPRSSREGIDGAVAGRIRVRVNAPPVDNAANRRVVELIADAFGVPKSAVEVVAGANRRDKRVRVNGARRLPQWYTPADVSACGGTGCARSAG